MDFITIDFEIANSKMSSACSLGMTLVENNQIIEEKYFLIQPPTLEFDESYSKIHGIKVDDVIQAYKFPEIWEEISHYFHENIIIAHNAQFDMSVLHSCLQEYSLEAPDFEYVCSIPISSIACKEKVGNGLKDRLNHFGIELEDHHHAGSDAKACAELVIKCLEIERKKSIDAFLRVYRSVNVKFFKDLKAQTSFTKRKNFGEKVRISEVAATIETFNINHIFYGKNLVFTGELQSIDRKEAMQKVVNLGGIVKSGVSRNTSFLVVGIQDKSLVGEEGLSSKEKKAFELIEKGTEIKIIRESEFIRLLED